MAAGSSEAVSTSREFNEDHLADLCDALHKVSTKYKFFGLQIGLKMHEVRGIAAKASDSADCLLEILSARLNKESALTCADIVKALKSTSVGEHNLATEFQREFENITDDGQFKESRNIKKAAKSTESDVYLKMSEKESKRIKTHYYAESEDESKSDESENIKKAVKCTEMERQLHERDEPKSKRAKKRAHKKERAVRNQLGSEQPEYEYEEDKRKQMNVKQKYKMHIPETAAGPQSGAAPNQKRNKSVKESEKVASQTMSTDTKNESFDAFKEKPRSERTGKVRESSELKHQPQSVKMKKLEAEETEPEESFLNDESESDNPKHRENVTPKSFTHTKAKSFTHTKEIYCDSDEEIEKVKAKDKKKMPQKSKVATAQYSPHSERLVKEEQYKQRKGKQSLHLKQESDPVLQAKASRGKVQKSHFQLEERNCDPEKKAKSLVAHSSEQVSDESETDSENSGNDSSEDGEDSEGKFSLEDEKTETDEESPTAPSEEEVRKIKEISLSNKKVKTKKKGSVNERRMKETRVSKDALEQSKYASLQGGQHCETCTRKVIGKRAAQFKYGSPGDDEQSDPGHESRDQEEHDIQQKKKQRRESSMSPTAIGSSSPSTSQEEKKKQPVSKKQGHRKKHVRKMKEKIGRMIRGKEKAVHSSGTDDSSPECDMTNNQYEGEKKKLVSVFEQFFGKLCCAVFGPKEVTAELQNVGLISKAMMRNMMLSPESQQAKIIALVDELDKKIKSHPDYMFVIIKVMLEIEALQEIAREILRETGLQCLVSVFHSVSDSLTLFHAGRVCPVETAAKLSSLPPSDKTFEGTCTNI